MDKRKRLGDGTQGKGELVAPQKITGVIVSERKKRKRGRKRVGSIRRDGGTVWYRIYVNGKQRSFKLGHVRDFVSDDEIHRAADRKLIELREMSYGTSVLRFTLEQFIEHWFLTSNNWRPSTLRGYRSIYRKHIRGRGEKLIGDWTTRDVQDLLRTIAAGNGDGDLYAKATLQRIKAFLSIVFRHAVVNGFRRDNPVQQVMLPRTTAHGTPTLAYGVEEVRRLLDGAESIAERAAIALAAYAGLRRAEISGLRWEDIDFKEGTISVRRTRWQGRESEPKSAASKNWVPIIRPLAAILREYRRAWSVPKPTRDEDGNEVMDASLFPFDLVFVGRKYSLKWHALRRGVATELFAAGASDLDVQRFLRHSKVLMTREHYIKLKDERVERSKRTLDRKFGAIRRK